MKLTAGICLTLALGVALGFIGFRAWLSAYLRSDSLRELINRHTSRVIGVTCTYMPLHWSGWSVYSDGFEGEGLPGNFIRSIRAEQIRGELHLHGIRHRTWELYNLNVKRLNVNLGQPGDASKIKHSESKHASSASTARSAFHPSDRIHLPSVVIQECNLSWKGSLTSPGRLEGLSAELTSRDNGWDVHATGGSLRQENLRVLNLQQLNLRYLDSVLYVTDAHVKIPDSGEISLSGNVQLKASPMADLLVIVQGIPVAEVVPLDWQARLEGTVEAEVRTNVDLLDIDKLKAGGSVALQSAVLHALPLLDNIAMFTGTEKFRRVTFQKAVASFDWSPGSVTVSNLVLESVGLLRVEGGLTITERRIDGTFELGVNSASLRWMPGSRKRVFTVDRDGYSWTPVRVNGPVDRLQEDLSPRLITAAGDEVIESTIEVIEKGAQDVFDVLMPLLPTP